MFLLLCCLAKLAMGGVVMPGTTWYQAKVKASALGNPLLSLTVDESLKCAATASREDSANLFCYSANECSLYSLTVIAFTDHSAEEGAAAVVKCNTRVLLFAPCDDGTWYALRSTNIEICIGYEPKDFEKSKESCEEVGGGLLIPTVEEEYRGAIAVGKTYTPDETYWFGAKGRNWLNGVSVQSGAWAVQPSESDDVDGLCGSIPMHEGGMVLDDCNKEYIYVCKRLA